MQIFNFNRNGTTPKTTHAEWIAIPHHIHMFECKFHRQTKAFRQFSQALTLYLSLSMLCRLAFLGLRRAGDFPPTKSVFFRRWTNLHTIRNERLSRHPWVWVCMGVCESVPVQVPTTSFHYTDFVPIFHAKLTQKPLRQSFWSPERACKSASPRLTKNNLKITQTNRTIWGCKLLGLAPTWECASLDICLYVYAGIPIHTLHAHTHTYKPPLPPPGICRFSSALLCVFSRLIDILRNISFYQLDR